MIQEVLFIIAGACCSITAVGVSDVVAIVLVRWFGSLGACLQVDPVVTWMGYEYHCCIVGKVW